MFKSLSKALSAMRHTPQSGPFFGRFLKRTKFDYAKEVGDGLDASVVTAPVAWMARAMPEARLVVRRRGRGGKVTELTNHKMLDLVARPNAYYGDVALWSATVWSWCVAGNAYWIKVRSRAGRPVELWYVPHWCMDPVGSRDGTEFLTHYKYSPGGGAEPVKLEPQDVVHFRAGLDPRNPRMGLSPLGGVIREIFMDLEASNFVASLLRNMGVPGVVISPMITETDIVDGRWDNAAVETWRVNWRDTTQRALMAKGSLGQIRRGKKAFVAEVRGMAHLLNQPVGRTYQSLCDALVGDVRCGVDLNDPAYQGTGAVTALASGRRFTVSGLDGFDGDWFAAGLLTWSTGQNAGRTVEVSEHDLRAGTVHVTLGTDPVRRVEIGDQFTITAGCDQRRATCAVKFANVPQFRGFDDIPGSDAVFRVARKAGANTGETL